MVFVIRGLPAFEKNYHFKRKIEQKVYEIRESLDSYSSIFREKELAHAVSKVPAVAEAWFRMIAFAETMRVGRATMKQVQEFWGSYWEVELPTVLGQVDIRWPETHYFLTRIKGAALASTEYMVITLGQIYPSSALETLLENACSQYVTIGESTIEIGLAYVTDSIIYWGENLLIHKGQDTKELAGELMIAVRHSTGCWNYYPSPNNYRVSLSEFKAARSALEQYPRPIKGELMHHQSAKLAELLGMQVEGKYAYLIR